MLAAHRLVRFRSTSIVRDSLSRYATKRVLGSQLVSSAFANEATIHGDRAIHPCIARFAKALLTTDFPRNNKTILKILM